MKFDASKVSNYNKISEDGLTVNGSENSKSGYCMSQGTVNLKGGKHIIKLKYGGVYKDQLIGLAENYLNYNSKWN